jgi:hypothetical protein
VRISPDLHSFVTNGLAGANNLSINGYAAFKTNAHSANAGSVGATHTESLNLETLIEQGNKQTGALFDFMQASIDQNLFHVALPDSPEARLG